MQDLQKRLLFHPEEAWPLIAASRPPLAQAIHPLTTLGMGVAGLGVFLRFLFIRSFKMAVAQLLLHLVLNLVALAALSVSIRKEARKRRGEVTTGSAVLAAGAVAFPVWLSTLLLALPMPVVEWLWLALGLGLAAYQYGFAAVSVMAVPEAEVRSSGVRILGPFAVVLLIGRIGLNLAAGNALFLH